MAIDYDELKQRTRASWTLGDYDRIAPLTLPAAEALVDACAVSAGQEVLDVAAGTGNLAILAARRGATAVAADITPALVAKGRARAGAEGVEVEWVEADAEALPFEDGRFDCAGSVFGSMFGPRPDVAARELFRVTRPGATVGMANWTPDSFPGRMFAVTSRHLPPPEGLPRPVDWGVEAIVEARLERLARSLECERRSLRWQFESVDAAIETFEHAGPHVATRQALGERYPTLRDDLAALIREQGRDSGGAVVLDCDYLLVVARRSG